MLRLIIDLYYSVSKDNHQAGRYVRMHVSVVMCMGMIGPGVKVQHLGMITPLS